MNMPREGRHLNPKEKDKKGVAAMTVSAKILIADSLHESAEKILKDGGLSPTVKVGMKEDELCALIGEYDGVIVRSATKITAKVIQTGKNLKLIGRAGVGVDNVDLTAAAQAGVIVENTPFGNIGSAAEMAVALLFAAARHVARADAEMKNGVWNKKDLVGAELSEKTLGLVGLGKVGSLVAKVAQVLNMKILAFDPFISAEKAAEAGAQKAELDQLLACSDFVSIHAVLTPETKGLLNAQKLAKMKKSAVLVNTARGGIVVEEDLAAALRDGVIRAAGLDVFATEPLAKDSPLLKAPNLTLTPHLGASTKEASNRVSLQIAEQFVAFFRDGKIVNQFKV
jgi:D-3-phosphoglycerate dehydrogenase